MKKYLLTLLCTVLFTAPTVANPAKVAPGSTAAIVLPAVAVELPCPHKGCYPPTDPQAKYCPNGFYAGGTLGMHAITARHVISVGAHENKTSRSGKSFIGGLFGGYGTCIAPSVYLGGELYTNSCVNQVRFAQTACVKHVLTNRANVGMRGRLGYVLSTCYAMPGMVFASIGGEYSRWHSTLTKYYAGGEEKITHKHGVFLSLGTGLEHTLTANTFVKYEYTFVKGPSVREDYVPLYYKTNANQHRFMAGLGYRF